MTATMRGYNAMFRCTAGCHGDHSIWQPLYRCPTCGSLLQVVHDVAALRKRTAAEWIRLFDDRYKRTAWPYGSGVWGKKEWVAPQLDDDNVVSPGRGRHQPVLGRALSAASSASTICGSSCAATATPAASKISGMTVLVSVVKQMIAHGTADPGGRVRVDRRHLGQPGRLLRGGGHPRRSCSCRAAGSRPRSSSSRSPTARWCSRSTPTSTAAWPSCSSSRASRASTWPTR